jgi:hypothetical protein
MMTNSETFDDLVASVEVVLDQSFKGASLSTLAQAVRTRVAELEGPAAREDEFDASSLELGVLKGLMAELLKVGSGEAATHATSLHVH